MLEIEIVDSNIIEGGVEVFARAWKDDQQIGFGKDGTVDIERFRIFNPPVLVDDPNGDIVREGYVDEANGITVPPRILREDPEEALLQSLTNIINQVGKDGSSIIPGKVGNTTSTFYSAAGASGNPIDGDIERSVVSETWTQTRDGTGTTTRTTTVFQFGQGEYFAGGTRYIISRSVLLFNTAAIPDADNISSASISVYATGTADTTNGDSGNFYSVTTAATNALANADFNIANWGTTAYSTAQSLSTMSSAGYKTWTLNATGIGAISKTGVSYFGQRSTNDVNNTTPTQRGYATFQQVDAAGTSQDPYLTVEHETPNYPLLTNLVSYWKLDETSGNRADSHGSNTLTDNNTVGNAAGILSNAADFIDTNSESLTIASSSTFVYNGASARSLSIWFRPDSVTGVNTIASCWGSAGSAQNWIIYMNGTNLILGVEQASALVTVSSSMAINTWYHAVMLLKTDGSAELYLNGTSRGTGTPSLSAGSNEIFALAQNTSTNYFDGRIDEVGWWNRVLTPSEITQLYNGGAGFAYPFVTNTFTSPSGGVAYSGGLTMY